MAQESPGNPLKAYITAYAVRASVYKRADMTYVMEKTWWFEYLEIEQDENEMGSAEWLYNIAVMARSMANSNVFSAKTPGHVFWNRFAEPIPIFISPSQSWVTKDVISKRT